MSPVVRAAVWGFLFGTLGMYLLAALALMLPAAESAVGLLAAPARLLAERFVGPVGSDAEVAMLSVATGALYALAFATAARACRALRAGRA